MKDLFVAIQNKLISDVPELKMIDFDLGQLGQEPLPPLSYPALLIAFGESPFVDLAGRKQEGNINLVLRVAFRTFERTHSIAQSQWRAIGLEHLDTLEKIKWCLHGFEGDCFTALSHRSFATEPRADLRVYQLQFETLLTAEPPEDQIQHIPWAQAGGTPPGPDFCAADEDGNPIE